MRFPLATEWIVCHAADCAEDEPAVLVACRDGHIRCAFHANGAGFCWDCGDGDPSFIGDMTDGMCHDCRAAYYRE